MENVKRVPAKTIISLLLVAVLLLSMLVFRNLYDPTPITQDLIKYQERAMKVTAACAAASIGLAAVPDDSTTPVANQIANACGYMTAATVGIQLEKYISTTAKEVTFLFLIPFSCLLGIICVWTGKKKLSYIATRFLILAICYVLVVPVSLALNSSISEVLKIDEIVEQIDQETQVEEGDENKDFFTRAGEFFSGLFNTVSNISEEAINLLRRLLDSISAFVLTACVVPILTILLLWTILKWTFKGIAAVTEGEKVPTVKR